MDDHRKFNKAALEQAAEAISDHGGAVITVVAVQSDGTPFTIAIGDPELSEAVIKLLAVSEPSDAEVRVGYVPK